MPNLLPITNDEALMVAVDFSPQMADSETIAASNSYGDTEVLVFNDAGEEKTSAMIEASSTTIDGQKVQARVYGTTAGESYSMNFFAATSTGNYLETKVIIRASD